MDTTPRVDGCPVPDGRVSEALGSFSFQAIDAKDESWTQQPRHTIVPDTRSTFPGDPPTTSFEGPMDGGRARGRLFFTFNESWMLPDLIGRNLAHTFSMSVLDCDTPGGQPNISDEPAIRAQHVLRDDKGQLLMLAGTSTPTGPDGKVYVDSALGPEFDVRWLKTDAPDCPRRAASLELTLRDTGERLRASAEQRIKFKLRDAQYVLAVWDVRAADGVKYCSVANWLVYRSDMLIRP
jgi:hypothetical protein